MPCVPREREEREAVEPQVSSGGCALACQGERHIARAGWRDRNVKGVPCVGGCGAGDGLTHAEARYGQHWGVGRAVGRVKAQVSTKSLRHARGAALLKGVGEGDVCQLGFHAKRGHAAIAGAAIGLRVMERIKGAVVRG